MIWVYCCASGIARQEAVPSVRADGLDFLRRTTAQPDVSPDLGINLYPLNCVAMGGYAFLVAKGHASYMFLPLEWSECEELLLCRLFPLSENILELAPKSWKLSKRIRYTRRSTKPPFVFRHTTSLGTQIRQIPPTKRRSWTNRRHQLQQNSDSWKRH